MADLLNMYEVCSYLKNFWLSDYINYTDVHKGTFTINSGSITPLDFLKEGQYFRIKGSALNDGVYQYTAEGMSELEAEEFTGLIWAMYIPKHFVKLCDDIATWRAKNEALDSANMSVFQSETVQGVYSYQKGSNGGSGSSGNGNIATWQSVFHSRLSPYRRISEL